MLYLFDLDGTLISSYMDTPNRNFNHWQVLPGRRERIAELVAEGHQIGIITNQAGVAYGFIDREQAREKLLRVAGALGYAGVQLHSDAGDPSHWSTYAFMPDDWQPITRRELPIFVCYDKDGPRRKPNGRMIEEAVDDAQIDYFTGDEDTISFADVPVLYVGDRPEDEQAAVNAGVPFQWAQEFFHE